MADGYAASAEHIDVQYVAHLARLALARPLLGVPMAIKDVLNVRASPAPAARAS
jgi:Asp-tRNA(Asn)/Glu-tRNA(Gln) amidotransferase A subunit family amidase